MHGEFLNVRGTKMSKRFGNITTARDLKNDGVDAGAIRLLLFQTHYRQKLDLTDEALDGAKEGATRLGNFRNRIAAAAEGQGKAGDAEALVTQFRAEFAAALDDDLNAPRAVGALFSFVTAANRLLDQGSSGIPQLAEAFSWATGVLDVVPEARAVAGDLKLWVEQRLEARREAKKKRDFVTADAIRAELAGRGVVIEDTPAGTKWRLA
jgi:cysteinyl-tRNA synthetase